MGTIFCFGRVQIYKRIRNEFTGVLTGKGVSWGGSLIRPEATGYGSVYFASEMLSTKGDTIEGKTCLVSGSGNVAQYTTEKINQLGGKVVTLSDSSGWVFDGDGIDSKKLAWVMDLKNNRRGRMSEYIEQFSDAEYHSYDASLDHNPMWSVPADCGYPSATQNEIINYISKVNKPTSEIELCKIFSRAKRSLITLEKNGILIIDDYGGWLGSKKAVDEFFKNKITTMFRIDREARFIIKN